MIEFFIIPVFGVRFGLLLYRFANRKEFNRDLDVIYERINQLHPDNDYVRVGE